LPLENAVAGLLRAYFNEANRQVIFQRHFLSVPLAKAGDGMGYKWLLSLRTGFANG